ncbi:MAG TPA: cell envelope biogenesis protein OmpA, partial [Brevundimonas sp.]|nr:cell envelope biogenesis protein OmpA [Brevundimonas sp.]HEV7228478.1 cell envelope biogenesis protein OmpA [Brevundimonas sp.]
RRARTVADALVARGVNSGVLRVDARGERDLARATADGVREPLNRRATIDINF